MAKNGYYYLKQKKEGLERELKQARVDLAEKEGIISQQATRISELTAESDGAKWQLKRAREEFRRIADEYYQALGWWRRWLWDIKHADNA